MSIRIGATCATLALVAALATSAIAQSAPPRIVQASDGTLYLLKDGSRFALVGEVISDDELAQYPDGGAAGSAVLVGLLPTPAPDLASQSGGAANGQIADAAQARPNAPQFVGVQGNSPGRTASVTLQTAPGDTCVLSYTTPSGTRSTAAGLGAQTASNTGVITWSFLIGGSTRRGVGTVNVSCPGGTISSPITIS